MNSKNKGNSFERKVANRLSARFEAITGKANAFRRNPDSGSFFGGSNNRKLTTHDVSKASFGDIICPIEFAYCIECKHYKQAPLLGGLLSGKIGDWDTWIKQAQQDSVSSDKRMAIVVKYNNVQELVILDQLPPGVQPLIRYNDFLVVTLEQFLALDDAQFFPQ